MTLKTLSPLAIFTLSWPRYLSSRISCLPLALRAPALSQALFVFLAQSAFPPDPQGAYCLTSANSLLDAPLSERPFLPSLSKSSPCWAPSSSPALPFLLVFTDKALRYILACRVPCILECELPEVRGLSPSWACPQRCGHVTHTVASLSSTAFLYLSHVFPKLLLFFEHHHISKILAFNFSLPAAAAKSLQSCPILCDPIDSSPPGSPVPGILQATTSFLTIFCVISVQIKFTERI